MVECERNGGENDQRDDDRNGRRPTPCSCQRDGIHHQSAEPDDADDAEERDGYGEQKA